VQHSLKNTKTEIEDKRENEIEKIIKILTFEAAKSVQ